MNSVVKRCPVCARPSSEAEGRLCPEHGLPLVEQHISLEEQPGPLTGKVLDHHYLVGGLAGKGGMGAVYVGENLRVGRKVAVKVVHPELAADPKMRIRLFREVQATSRINHPNVVEILDYGHDADVGSYLVMEYLGGQSLGQLIRERGPLPISLSLKITTQLGSALSATHRIGVIHRDLKPSNVRLLPDGRVKVLDFGLVKPFEPGKSGEFATITSGGIAFGTPWYMSPEQAGLKPLDPRSDVYSLGVVLYEMLTGQTPFLGDNPLDLIDAQRTKPVPLPRHLEPPVELPTSFELLLLKMLNKDPECRPQSMTELINDLYSVADEEKIDLSDIRALPNQPHRPTPSPVPTEDIRPTMPMAERSTGVVALHRRLQGLVADRVDDLCNDIVDELRSAFPHYRTLDREHALSGTRTMMESAVRALGEEPEGELPAPLRELADERVEQQFALTEVLGSYLLGMTRCRPLIMEAAERDVDHYLALQEQVDRRLLHLYLRLVDYYATRFNARLVRLNDVLSRRNEQLQQLRAQLSEELRSTSQQLGSLEQLKARVVESISCGLMLMEHGSRNVVLFNRAMERIFGVSAEQVIDRSIDDVLRYVEGVPQEEFSEQIRLHGQVGLRKLRVKSPAGRSCVIYLRGETFFDAQRKPAGTLFIVDDVTEREQIIETFSRYVSRDVADHVMRTPTARPMGETKQVILLGCRLPQLCHAVKDLPVERVTDFLARYVSLAGEVFRRHGGILDTIVGDSLMGYFPARADCGPAMDAAVELRDGVARLSAGADADADVDLAKVRAALGIHVGQVMLLHVGGPIRMTRAVVGDAVVIVSRLRHAAAEGEILLTELAKDLASASNFDPGPTLQQDTHPRPLATYRLLR